MRRTFISVTLGACMACALVAAGAGCEQPRRGELSIPPEEYAGLLLELEDGGPNTKGAREALHALLGSPDMLHRAAAAQLLGAWAAQGDPCLVLPCVTDDDALVRGLAQAAYIENHAHGLGPLVVDGVCMEVEPDVLRALRELYDPKGLVDLEAVIAARRDGLRAYLESDETEAVLAADILARICDAGARSSIVKLVESDQALVAAKAARACTYCRMGLGPAILPSVFDGPAAVRRAIMQALVLRPDPRLAGLVRRGMGDADATVRRNAVRAAGNLGAAAPVEELQEALGAKSANQHDVIRALGAVGQPAAGILRGYIKDGAGSAELEIEAMLALAPSAGRDDIGWIAKRLDAPDKHVRAAAAAALGHIGHPSAQAALMDRVDDPEPLVRATVARALGQIGTVYASKQLVVMLSDPSALVRSMAAWGLGHTGYSEASASLEGLAASPSAVSSEARREGDVYGQPRLAAVEALGRMSTVSAVEALKGLADAPSWSVRAKAAKALGATGTADGAVIASLENRLTDPVGLVRAESLLGLKALGKTYPPGHFQIP